jgi:hypothetical protein
VRRVSPRLVTKSRLSQPLDLLHRTGSIANHTKRQTDIEAAVSRNQDQEIARYPAESRNTPATLPQVVDDRALDDPVSGYGDSYLIIERRADARRDRVNCHRIPRAASQLYRILQF